MVLRALNRKTPGVPYNRGMRTHTVVAALLLAAATLSSSVSAEPAGAAQFHVQVVDVRNAPLPGATVTIYTLDGNPGVTATADAHGVAQFASIAPGMTQVVARSDRFTPSIAKVTVEPGDNARTVRLHLDSDDSE
jgi:protocatechuate 3,4-dioxygenase beta subunit